MKLSQFTMFVEDHPQAGRHLAYNTLSRALVEVDDRCLSILHSLEIGEPPASAEPVLQKLQAQGIVVPTELDEAESYHQKFSTQRTDTDQLHATILTTLECPMRCTYCYQKHIRGGGHMSPETMEKTVSWLEEQISKRKINRCFITFYGGEPLMNFNPIEYIGSKIGEYCRDKRVSLYLAMVTSGILLMPEVAEKLKRIGLKYLRITLDGDRDAHDKRRPMKDGSGTFDLIMDNLRRLAEDFFVTITCNVDKANSEAAYRLVDILDSQGFAGKIKRLIFGPVSATFESAQRGHIACPETTDEDLLSLTLHAANKGFASDLRPGHKICGMLLPNHFVIDPDGKLYTCPAFLGRDEYQSGDVNHFDDTDVHELQNLDLNRECLECVYVPICAGGCRFNALIEHGDIQAASCKKETFSYSLPLLLKKHYTLRNKDVQSPDIT